MFLKLTGANKTSQGLDKVSKSTKELDTDVKNSSKSNAQFAAGMSGMSKAAIAGAAIFAGRALVDFARDSVMAASSAQEAAGAFGTTFGDAAANLTKELEKNANLFGLTTSEAQQLIGVFGAVAQGMGFTQNESADLSSRLFELSGDIASFNNISAGAEPVLRAFQSAIVGEREALKTYGIAISEAEVQTKAFEMTGKTSADALTRQEKALATTELLFQKASVQIGNAEREAEGFAAQMLQTRAKTQQFREELGEQLLPAAGKLLGFFNGFIDTTAPLVVTAFEKINTGASKFGELNSQIWEEATEEIEEYSETIATRTPEILKFLGYLLTGQMAYYNKNKDQLDEVTKELDKYSDSINENTDVANKNSVQVIGSTGITMGFMDVVKNINDVYAFYNQQIKENRQQVLISTTQTKKYGEEIDKKLNPIFGESNSLILSNIQLEVERRKILDLITSGNKNVAVATEQRNQAAKELQELQIQENVRDAEAAIRKAELQTKIALLTEAQSKGKDVTLDLALAEAQLAEAEFELANDSDRLKLARDALTIAENNLEAALKNQETARAAVKEALIGEIEATKEDTKEKHKNADAIQRQIDLMRLFKSIETDPFRFQPPQPEPEPEPEPSPEPEPETDLSIDPDLFKALEDVGGTDTPADTLGDNSNVITGNGGGGDTNLNLTLELDGDALQQYNIKLQKQGKTFQVR
jgi:cell division protein ZapA (FtsZ GTPase activity inhibitor)